MKKIFSFLFIFLLSTGSRLFAYEGGKITDVIDGDYSSSPVALIFLIILFVIGFVAVIFRKRK